VEIAFRIILFTTHKSPNVSSVAEKIKRDRSERPGKISSVEFVAYDSPFFKNILKCFS